MLSWRKSWMFLALAALLILPGCALLEQPSSLIQQPDLTHENRQLLRNVDGMLPDGARLISPASSTIKGRILRLSLEKDSQQQAAFFYQTVSGVIHFSVIDKQGKGWQKIYDQKVAANRQIDVALTNDGPDAQPELMMTTEYTAADRVTVYAMHKGRLDRVLSSPFNGWIRGYLDGDGHPHLAFIVRDPISRKAELMDYVMDMQAAPVRVKKINLAGSSGDSSSLRQALQSFRMSLIDPGVSQLNELSGWEPGAVQSLRKYNSAASLSLVRSDSRQGMGEGGPSVFQRPVPVNTNYRFVRRLAANPFYPIDNGAPAEERYYNSAHHFFIDFPDNIAGDLILSQEASTHVLFLRKDSNQPYISIYWIQRSRWNRGSYASWIKIGTSDHYVFAVPVKYKDAAAAVKFGVYNDEQDNEN